MNQPEIITSVNAFTLTSNSTLSQPEISRDTNISVSMFTSNLLLSQPKIVVKIIFTSNTAQLGFARLGLMGLGQDGRAETVARAITDSSAKGTSNYFISAWVQEPIPTSNPRFGLLNKIDECLQNLENRIPKPIDELCELTLYAQWQQTLEQLNDLELCEEPSIQVEHVPINSFRKSNCKLDRVNCRLDKLRKKKEAAI